MRIGLPVALWSKCTPFMKDVVSTVPFGFIAIGDIVILSNEQAEAQRVFLEEQKRKRQAKEAEDDFMLLFWLNETI